MKPCIILAFLFSVVSLLAEDITTRIGRVYKNATITAVTAAYISITHDDGTARVMLRDLPEELQKKCGYDPAIADQIMAAEAAAQQKAQDQQKLPKAASQATGELGEAIFSLLQGKLEKGKNYLVTVTIMQIGSDFILGAGLQGQYGQDEYIMVIAFEGDELESVSGTQGTPYQCVGEFIGNKVVHMANGSDQRYPHFKYISPAK